MRVAVVGAGIDGVSAADYYAKLGHNVTILASHTKVDFKPKFKTVFGEHYLDELERYDLVVRSPGVHPNKLDKAKKVTTPMNEFFARCPAPIIGVTGTKGKSTTSSLITHILTSSGKSAHLAGNIGVPVLDIINLIKPEDYVVLELSNFQLIDLRYSPHIAVLLRISVDHLDWHNNLDDYQMSKKAIFANQKSSDIAIYRADDELALRFLRVSSAKTKIPFSANLGASGAYVKNNSIYYEDNLIIATDKIPLLGTHNIENTAAAVAATYNLVQSPDLIAGAIETFKSLPHRLQLVATINGVSYIDDSIATNPDTTIAAINSFAGHKVLILGGSDKGHDFDRLADVIADPKSRVRSVVLIGAMSDKIALALAKVGFNSIISAQNLRSAVIRASQIAGSSDVVLLSPACASFDMFVDYKDRGEQFISAVKELV